MSNRKLKYYWKNSLQIIKKREDVICELDNKCIELERAVALLNSMVEGGECHSETSRQVVRDALGKTKEQP